MVDMAALQARAYLEASGRTDKDLAEVAARSQRNAQANPNAVRKGDVSADDILKQPVTHDPLRDADIPPITDGAAAVVIAAGDLARAACERPAWIKGIEHRIEAHSLGVRDLSESVASIVTEDPRKLEDIPGIGESVAAKCRVLVETGELPQLKELLQKIPASVLDMVRIPGLGPKRAAVLFHELGIRTLDQLKAACEEGRVRELKGFGEKSEKAILDGIGLAASAGERIKWRTADDIAGELRGHMQESPAVQQLAFAGSYLGAKIAEQLRAGGAGRACLERSPAAQRIALVSSGGWPGPRRFLCRSRWSSWSWCWQ